MSLTSFIGMADVKERMKPFRPKLARKINVPLKVEPRSNRFMLVGTAFDYLLRFELQRLAPNSTSERWVAEYAPDILWRKTSSGAVGLDLLVDADPANYMSPEVAAQHTRTILTNAKSAVADYVKNKQPSRASRTELARHAIRLAKLDSVCRAYRLVPDFDQAADEDVQDLIDMLAIVPFRNLIHADVMLLNPTFGATSLLVGGADTDLIAGEMLVDFKTTKHGEMNAGNLDQLLGYYLLACKQRLLDPTFPSINRLGLYFCRHGHLWSVETSAWEERSDFRDLDKWFFQRAKEVFGMPKKAT